MNKKFRKLLEQIKDVHLRDRVQLAIPEIYQKQFVKFLMGAKKIKPFFMKWLGKNFEARTALELVMPLKEALGDGEKVR